MTNGSEIGQVLFEWTAKEFEKYQRGMWWHVVVLGVGALSVAYAVYTASWFFIGVVVAAVFALYALGRVTPRNFTHLITDQGLRVGSQFYAYSALKSFWVVNDANQTTLNVVTAKRFDMLLTLQINRSDVEKIRQILLVYLPEQDGRGEDTVDKIGRWLKF